MVRMVHRSRISLFFLEKQCADRKHSASLAIGTSRLCLILNGRLVSLRSA